MFSTFSFITHRSTTMRPARCVQSETIRAAFSSASNTFVGRFGNSSSSNSFSENQTINNTLTSYENINNNDIGLTSFLSWSKNSRFSAQTIKNSSGSNLFSTSFTSPLATATDQTTRQTTFSTQIRVTTTRVDFSFFYTTSTIGTKKTTARTKIEYTQTINATKSTALSRITTTTSKTTGFSTWSDWSEIGTLVADTIYSTDILPFNQKGDLILKNDSIDTSENQISKEIGVNELEYVTKFPFTSSWKPPLSFEETRTTTAFTTTKTTQTTENSQTQRAFTVPGGRQTTGFAIQRFATDISTTTTNQGTSTTGTFTLTRETTTSSSSTFLSYTEGTKTIEDFITFTTFSGNPSFRTTSFSSFINSGNEELGQSSGPNFGTVFSTEEVQYTFQSSTTTSTTSRSSSFQTNFTTSVPASFIKRPILSKFLEIAGIAIQTYCLPWITNVFPIINTISSLNSDTSETTSRSTTDSWITLYSTNYQTASSFTRLNSGSFSNSETNFSYGDTDTAFKREDFTINKSGTVYNTITPRIQRLNSDFSPSCWKMQQNFFGSPFLFGQQGFYAANPDLNFNTTPTRTGAPILLELEGNQHTIVFLYDENFYASIVPREIVSPLPLTFSTLLNLNTDGGINHPSKWSSMTVSRAGASLSSTWQVLTEEKISTFSGQCFLKTESVTPYGTQQVSAFNGSTILGGNMQPNTKIESWGVPGVLHTQNESESGFVTQSMFSFSTISPNEKITIFRTIPIVSGEGVFRTSIVDDGMP
jgi:hypothetical protein